MTHRKLLFGRSTAIAAIAVGGLALSACSGGGAAAGGSGTGSADPSRLTIALEADQAPNGYDPLRYASIQRFFFEGMYDSLFEIDADGRIVPSAATGFSYSDDFTQMTIDVDTALTFEDGTPLSAQLVKDNLDRRGESDLNAYRELAVGGEAEISDVAVVDEDTLTLTFAGPQRGYEGNLVFPAGALVGPKGLADQAALDAAPDGSGPLTIDAQATIKGSSYLQVKKENTERGDEYPFETYEFRPIVDPQARVNAVISGQVDLAFLTADSMDQVESGGKAVAVNGGTVLNILPFDKAGATNPAFGDPRVWKALSIAIDRESFVDAVHPGDRPTANVLPEESPGYLPELEEEYAYDPEGAKELLAEAGYADGLEFDFIIQQRTQRDLEVLKTYWAEIGVTVNLVNASSTEQRFAAVQTSPAGGPFPTTWTNPLGVVNGVLFGFANFHGATAPEIQAAAQAWGAASDEAGKAAALGDLNRAIADAGWLLPLYEQLSPWGYDQAKVAEPTFAGAEPYPVLATLEPAE